MAFKLEQLGEQVQKILNVIQEKIVGLDTDNPSLDITSHDVRVPDAGTVDDVLYQLEINKQENLVSGQNIKTINGQSLLEGGNISLNGTTLKTSITSDESITDRIYTKADKSTKINGHKLEELEINLTGNDIHTDEVFQGGGTIDEALHELNKYRTDPEELAYINGESLINHGENIQIDQDTIIVNSYGSDETLREFVTETNEDIHLFGNEITDLQNNKADNDIKINGKPITDDINLLPADIPGLLGAISAKQNVLVSGNNIKTVNGHSILGKGNLVVSTDIDIEQTTGQSITAVMSQKATTDALTGKVSTSTKVNGKTLTGDIVLDATDIRQDTIEGEVNVDQALHALDSNKIDYDAIAQETGYNENKIMSQKAVTDALAGKADIDNEEQEISLGALWFDGNVHVYADNDDDIAIGGNKVLTANNVTQTTGQSTTDVMSQKATTDAIKKNKNTLNAYDSLDKVSDYLYTAKYGGCDYAYAKEFFKGDAPVNLGACSSMVANGIYGRNYDWHYNNEVSFLVQTPADNDKHSVMGIASVPTLDKAVVDTGEHNELYRILPFYLQDGINDAGLVCNINVVPNDKGDNSLVQCAGDVEDTLCVLMLVRYILDHFESAEDAFDYILEHINLYHPQALLDAGYNVHFMIADSTKTYVLEFADGEYMGTDEYNKLTNFHVSEISTLESGKVFTQFDIDGVFEPSDFGITANASGLERYNLMVDANISDAASMRSLMNSLMFTNAYTKALGALFWYSEFVGGNMGIDTPVTNTAYLDRIASAKQDYQQRQRGDGKTWQTTHSVVYDLAAKTANVVVQEDTANEYDFTLQQQGGGCVLHTYATIDDLSADIDNLAVGDLCLVGNGAFYLVSQNHFPVPVCNYEWVDAPIPSMPNNAQQGEIVFNDYADAFFIYNQGGWIRIDNGLRLYSGADGEQEMIDDAHEGAISEGQLCVLDNVPYLYIGGQDETFLKLGGAEVTQTTGTSTTSVMSQKAITDIIGDLTNIIDAI